jgi:hypothetical protein
MPKKPKTVQVGNREYFESLLVYYTNRSTAIMRGRGNLTRDDLEYLAQAAAKLKDERLKTCIAELIGWGDEERSELETLLAIGFEAMKLCSPSRLREAAMRVSLKYYMKKEFSHAQHAIEQEDARLDGVPASNGDASLDSQSVQAPAGPVPGGVLGPRDEDVQHP